MIRVPDRDAVQRALSESGVGTAVHYPIPVHLQPAYARPSSIGPLRMPGHGSGGSTGSEFTDISGVVGPSSGAGLCGTASALRSVQKGLPFLGFKWSSFIALMVPSKRLIDKNCLWTQMPYLPQVIPIVGFRYPVRTHPTELAERTGDRKPFVRQLDRTQAYRFPEFAKSRLVASTRIYAI